MGERSGKTVESVGSPRRGSRARGGLAAASTAVGALLLSACGAVSGEPASEGTSTGSSPASQAPTSAPAGDAPARVTPLASPSMTNVPSLSNAIPIRSIVTAEFGGDRIAIIKTPSGNIGCDFYTDGSSLGCGVQSLIGTTRRDASGESMWWVDFTGARAVVRSKTDAPYFGYSNPAAQIAQYGTTLTTGKVACRSEKTDLTCWNLSTGAGAVMNREQGIRPFTKPPAGVAAPVATPRAQVVAGPGPGDATYDVVLNGLVPATVLPEASPRPVRMTRGRAEGFSAENPRAAVWVKGIDDSQNPEAWKRDFVRFADVAGDGRKEAIVVLSRTLGGVPWPDGLAVYDADGRVVFAWDTREAGGDPRSGTSLIGGTGTSVDVRIVGTDPSSGGARQVGSRTYRLSKGADGKPAWRQIAKSRS